ncbi:hypothetical protein ATN89_17150 [Comamonas thiooxydans]|uniref:ribonucleotide-diphosphate reductase subunit beta n=1 Tax=Comamonas thiooxydans TaxID=363952 RepID=UPI0007C5060D|nr:ribonucleotide-diphosphate reductase subunit beta [Comamonas thiooxydans]OAD82945.1 hypothetical protein ATN89_17150 [Comamonas thiooxydans]
MTTSTQITNNRRLAFGESDMLMNMSRVRYPWASEIYERMEANTWFPKSVPLGEDRAQYRSDALTPAMRRAYDYSLAFVSNLDGIQFNNLIENIGACVTAPEVKLCLARQASEEGVHVRSYQFMAETISFDPESVYMLYMDDKMLEAKNNFIMANSRILRKDPNDHNFARALVSNLNLEGLHFYNNFLVFYVLGYNGLMKGSADMIKYINRDEGETHLDLFTHMLATHRMERPEVYGPQFDKDARDLILAAYNYETAWGLHCIGKGFLGLTPAVIEGFGKERANVVAERAGIEPVFPEIVGKVSVVPWFEQFSRPNGTRSNFFERKPTDYAVDGLEWE